MGNLGQRGLNNGYEKYYKAKLESGLLYQDFVVDLAYQAGIPIVQYASKAYQLTVGESRTGIEIKNDEKFASTGNLWIETAEKARQRDGPYATSGIYREGPWWLYAIGNYDVVFFFAKNFLQRLDKVMIGGKERYRHLENNTRTSRGFLLPETDAYLYAAFHLKPNAEKKIVQVIGDLAKLGQELHAIVKGRPDQRSLYDLWEQQGANGNGSTDTDGK